MQRLAPLTERVVDVLVRAGAEAVCRNREALDADSGHGGISQSSGCARKEYDRDRQDEGKRAKKIGEQGVDRRRR